MKTLSGAVVMNSGTHGKIIDYINALKTKNIVWDAATQLTLEMPQVLQGQPYSITLDGSGKVTKVKAKSVINDATIKTEFSIENGRMFCKAEFA